MSSSKEKYQLWQHPNGYIYVCWTELTQYNSEYSRQQTKRVSTGSTDWAAAEIYRAQFIAGLKNVAPPSEPTIGYLLGRYREEHGVNTRSLETIDFHIKVLKPFFGDLQPNHLSNNLLKDYAKARGVSAGTILRELGTLKAAIHYAEGNRWIEQQPQFMMPVNAPPPRDLWLTREQITKLIDTAKSPHMKLFILLAVSTAARSGAILELTWDQIDFERRLVDFGRGWGNKRRAIVPIGDHLLKNLLTAKELAQSNYVIEYHSRRVASIKSGFRRLCKECGIKASPHVLRHTAATWLITDGVPLSEVARLLGDSEKTVEKVYGHHSPDFLRRAVNTLDPRKVKGLSFDPT